MTNVVDVTRQDLLDARRSYLVWGVAGIYVLLTALIFWVVGGVDEPSTGLALQAMSLLGIVLVPLVALVAGYLAVAGERESGTIRFLLGYPTSRAEVVVGKLLSRLAIVDGAILAAILAGVAVALVRFPGLDLTMVAGFTALTLLFTSAYVSVAVGISAAVGSRARAMAGAVGAYFLFNVTWSILSPVTVPDVVNWALGELGVELSAETYQFLFALSPPIAYTNALELVSADLTVTPASEMSAAYLSPAAMVAVLVGWCVLPLLVGYARFRSAQIA